MSRCKAGGNAKVATPKAAAGPGPRPQEISFTIPLKPLSVNETFHAHWRLVFDEKKKWATATTHIIRPYAGLCLWWSEWQITRLYTGKEQEMDEANLVGSVSLKAAIDVLVREKLIVDDKPKHFKAYYHQERTQETGVRFTLTNVRDQTPNAG